MKFMYKETGTFTTKNAEVNKDTASKNKMKK